MAVRLFTLLLFLSPFLCRGNEGFWLPIHLERLQGIDLQKMGLHLTAEEIYSINSSSLKDAIASYNGNCTAEVISKSGLILTNHHCGYHEIQRAATLNNNILNRGHWALTLEQEIPGSDSYVSFLVRMDDVTGAVLRKVKDISNEADRQSKIDEITKELVKQATEGTLYNAEVKSFFSGNEFYLFIYETYEDIRLVGAPPEGIGRFGGETDNWEWPKHAGDFALFRIYTATDGKPSAYSPSNVPLRSSYHLPISLEGVHEGSTTLVMGYPGKTKRYSTSYGVKFYTDHINPGKIDIMQHHKEVLLARMDQDRTVNLDYASRLVELNNSEKYYLGQSEAIGSLQVVREKKKLEQEFKEWCLKNSKRAEKFGGLENTIKKGYHDLIPYYLYNVYLVDGIFSSELMLYSYHFSGLYEPLVKKYPKMAFEEKLVELEKLTESHFSKYHPKVDQDITAAMISLFYHEIPDHQQPDILRKAGKKSNGNFQKWCANLFKRSMFTDPVKVQRFLENPQLKTLTKDPAYKFMRSLVEHYYGNIAHPLKETSAELNQAYRLRHQGLSEMQQGKTMYSDANGTLRISFGKVKDYQKHDGTVQPFRTTMSGLVEKTESQNPDYQLPARLIELCESNSLDDYGEDGILPISFITDNDISGGSSGSPVLNSRGELIGIVSDSNSESLASDFYYDDRYQRSINIDIRYVLFIIDQYAGAGSLIDEMTLVEIPNPLDNQIPQKTQFQGVE